MKAATPFPRGRRKSDCPRKTITTRVSQESVRRIDYLRRNGHQFSKWLDAALRSDPVIRAAEFADSE